MPLDDLKAAGTHFGASINDLFLAGLTEGAVRYHADREVEVDAFNTSFVLSTRSDHAIGGNSFTPIPVQVAVCQCRSPNASTTFVSGWRQAANRWRQAEA